MFIQPKYDSKEYAAFSEEITGMKFDMLLCNCYSMIIRKEILESVHYNAINIHWSLLPFNKGPNPTQWAIIKGEDKTGITVHYMDEGLDTGDIIAQKEERILETDTWVCINDRLIKTSANLLLSNIDSILKGSNNREKQNLEIGSVNKRLTAESPMIDFTTMSNLQIFNLVRAQVEPLKGAYIIKDGKSIHFTKYMTLEEVKALRNEYAG